MSAADLVAFRAVLVTTLRRSLPDPRDAEWLADLSMATQRQELAGQTIPTREAFDLADAKARAAELLRQGVPAAIIARRVNLDKSTIYRIAALARAA